jgi:hypothetical protein
MAHTRGTLEQQLLDLIYDIRLELRDYTELNQLVEGQESTDRYIAKTVKIVLDSFNGMPPPLGSNYSWNNCPDRSLLITGVIGRLQRQVADLDDRNFYPGTDGQVSNPSRQKGQLVRRASQEKWQEFTTTSRSLRISLNYREAMGGLGIASEEGMILLDDYLRGRITPLSSIDPFGK